MSDDAFSQLVDMYYPSLYRFALSLARSEADACDLAQQTFYVWAKKGHALREAAKAKSWLFTTLYREFLRGRRRGERMTALDTVPENQLEEVTLEPETVASMDGGVVMGALQEVDEIFRAPLTLFYLEELSYQEIAEALDVPVGTVMSRLSRGKAQLRTRLVSRIGTKPGTVVPFQNSTSKASHG
jgi:RNA polymerase sigma-70 factor (ECF subfamily)